MKTTTYLNTLAMIIAALLTACGSSSNNDNNNNGTAGQRVNRLNWSSIPSEFNPHTFEENFQTNNINRIYIDMFGFKDDVEIIYTDSLAQGQGYLKIYSVYKDSGSSGSFNSTTSGQSLQLNRYGTYTCSIKTENGNITQLKGLCFVRMQIFLPPGAEIEIYNIKQLISKRFIPIDSETLIKNIKEASFVDGKNAAIEDYISSYKGMNKSPELTAAQLGIVVKNFNFKEDKFNVLRKLHIYVIDRHNLAAMIESEISYFDRDEAKRICGL